MLVSAGWAPDRMVLMSNLSYRKVGVCALCSCLTLQSGAAGAEDADFFGLLQLDVTDVEGGSSPAGGSMLSARDVLRSLKLGVGKSFSNRLEAQVEIEVSSDGSVNLDDTYLLYRLTENTSISVGYYKVYHSLTAATSERKGGLPERSMVSRAFEVGTGGQLGAFFHSSGNNWSLQAGLSLDDVNGDTSDTDGWGLHGRVSYAPVLSDNGYVHVGFSAYHRNEKDDLLELAERPGAWIEGPPVFASGLVAARHYSYANAEFAVSRGPWLVQAEYGGLQTGGAETYRYDGGYIAASYVLTGEHRPYEVASGSFASLVPGHPPGKGAGAWEIAVRFSHLDLRDRGMGNIGESWSTSLNWYPSADVRVMLNATDFSANGFARQTGHTLGLRMQLSW